MNSAEKNYDRLIQQQNYDSYQMNYQYNLNQIAEERENTLSSPMLSYLKHEFSNPSVALSQ